MIRVYRTEAPSFFRDRKFLAAKQKMLDIYSRTERQERFHFELPMEREVRKQLTETFNGKCAYCETKIKSSAGDVELFRPKGGARGLEKEYAPWHYWWLAYEWDNMLLSCEICSRKYKRDFFPLESESLRSRVLATGSELLSEQPLLVDPCNDEPGDHLEYTTGGEVKARSKKGEVTINILGLNRKELVEERRYAAKNLLNMLHSLNDRLASQRLLQEMKYTIDEIFSPAGSPEYLATLRAAFQEWYQSHGTLWDSLFPTQQAAAASSQEEMPGYTSAPPKMQHRSIDETEMRQVKEQLSSIKRFSIRSVQICNFKSIDELKIEVLPVDTTVNRESWLLLLGDNGIGKSSILQAISLALAGEAQLQRLNLDVTDFLQRGTESGFVKVTSYENDATIELLFDKKGFTTNLAEPPTYVLGYGSTRLLPKGSIQPATGELPYSHIDNLMDYSVSLCDPHAWLRTVDTETFNTRIAPVFFDVLALRDDDKLYLDNGRIMIRQFGEDTELEDNSDGYKTIVALVTDIMKTFATDAASYHNSQGIVLIDEIGNHLHPRWRMKIVGALRKAFPNLQFVVTTHEPLCLRGLAHGEVVVLVRDHNKVVRALDKELLPNHNLMRIEQLLTSDLFGLINVMDEATEKTYEEYYELLAKRDEEKTAADLEKIHLIQSNVIQHEVLGSTPQEQVFYKVIKETFVKKAQEEGFKTTEKLKQETVAEVKALVTKNFDWL